MTHVAHARFYAPGLQPEPGRLVVLSPDEAAHLAQVLRLRAGDAVRVFDGAGVEFAATIETAGRTAASVRLIDQIPARPEPRVRLTLAQAILKGEAFDQVVRDATMAGVRAIRPVLTSLSTPRAGAGTPIRRLERWRRVAIASAKQCGRATLPAIDEPIDLGAWFARDHSDVRLILAEPASAAAVPGSLAALRDHPAPPSASLLVGPEGGWTGEETATALGRGVVPLTLGSLTLRADAAAVVAVSALFTAWDAW